MGGVRSEHVKAVAFLEQVEIPYRQLIELAGACGSWELAQAIVVSTFARDPSGKHHWLSHLREYFMDLSFLKARPGGFFGLALGLFNCAYDPEKENQEYNQALPEIVSLFICLDLESVLKGLCRSPNLDAWAVENTLKDNKAYHAAISKSIRQYFGVKTSQRLRVAQEILQRSQSLGGVKNQAWGWLLGNLIVDNIAFALLSAMPSNQKASAVLSASNTFIDAMEDEEREQGRKRQQARLEERERAIRMERH